MYDGILDYAEVEAVMKKNSFANDSKLRERLEAASKSKFES
jgi:hypothetical protein